jgi:hypothetical protein
MSKTYDLHGMRFHSLVVFRLSPIRAGAQKQWVCRCDCGQEATVRSQCLRTGWTKSCGCRKISAIKARANPDKASARRAGNSRYAGQECNKCGGTLRYARDSRCCECAKARAREARRALPAEQRKALDDQRREWKEKNPGRDRSMQKMRYEKNPQRYRAHASAYAAIRRANEIRATPPWADLDAIRYFYEGRPYGYHVDHIYPLKGRLVSGLHIVANLQYLPAIENIRKSNRLPDEGQ